MKKTRKYEKVIIGSTLSALARAYYNGVPILVAKRPEYYFFDKIGGIETAILWKRFAFCLSMAGLMPFGDKITNVYYEGEKISVLTSGNARYDVHADTIVEIIPEIKKKKGVTVLEVLDWFYVIKGRKHEHYIIRIGETREEGLKKLLFYDDSEKTKHKNMVVAVSLLSEGKDYKDDNTELITTFAAVDAMKAKGIRGMKNGKDEKGRQKWLPVRLEHLRRIKRPLYIDDEASQLLELKSGAPTLDYRLAKLFKVVGDPLEGCELCP